MMHLHRVADVEPWCGRGFIFEFVCGASDRPGNGGSPDYEFGGQEFESLRARHEINNLAVAS